MDGIDPIGGIKVGIGFTASQIEAMKARILNLPEGTVAIDLHILRDELQIPLNYFRRFFRQLQDAGFYQFTGTCHTRNIRPEYLAKVECDLIQRTQLHEDAMKLGGCVYAIAYAPGFELTSGYDIAGQIYKFNNQGLQAQ